MAKLKKYKVGKKCLIDNIDEGKIIRVPYKKDGVYRVMVEIFCEWYDTYEEIAIPMRYEIEVPVERVVLK